MGLEADIGDRTCTSSIYAAAYGQIQQEFHVSRTVSILGLSMYVIGLAFGPLFLAPLSEVSTRSCRSHNTIADPLSSTDDDQYTSSHFSCS
jgi:hypothetical protein